MVGGGVGDSYQPIEKKYQLSRKTLKLIYEYNFPVKMLTKSTLIKRDVDILKMINVSASRDSFYNGYGRINGSGNYNSLNLTFNRVANKYKIPKRIPPALYSDILSENDLVIVMLEHIDYLLKLEGKKSPFGFAT